jgi:hypothetical protein
MSTLRSQTKSSGGGRGTIALLVVLTMTLAVPVSSFAGNSKKKTKAPAAATKPAGPMVDLSKIDITKLVWPQPPSIPRVRYTTYYAGEKIDYTPAKQKKTECPSLR